MGGSTLPLKCPVAPVIPLLKMCFIPEGTAVPKFTKVKNSIFTASLLNAVFLILISVSVADLAAGDQPAQQQPNVIVIISDDAGYADFGFARAGLDPQGSTSFRDPETGLTIDSLTPNLDALARRGVTCSRAYVAANCQPTRAAIVTGGYQQRIGNENVGNNNYLASEVFEGIPDTTKTIWDRVKSLGYTTGAVGKWHLGSIEDHEVDGQLVRGNRPQNQGIDEFRGIWHGSRGYIVGTVNNNPTSKQSQTQLLREAVVGSDGTVSTAVLEHDARYVGDYITNTFGELATDFITRHADDGHPFMLYHAFTAPHKPWTNESPDYNDPRISGLREGSYRRQVASLQITMDKEIGRIINRLEDPNSDGDNSDSITDNTLIIFINDNGGVAGKDPKSPGGQFQGVDNGPFSGFKGSPKDGGIRVPMIIAGAGVSPTAEGSVFAEPVHGIDILPTVFAAAGGEFGEEDSGIDGVNLLPYINGKIKSAPHEVLVHKWRGTFAVIEGDYKLVNTANLNAGNKDPEFQYRLYNTANDIAEDDNLINNRDQVDRVAHLKRVLTNHEAFFDKGRYAILSRRVDDDTRSSHKDEPRNIFDHFVANPNGTSDFQWSDPDLWLASKGVDNLPHSDASSRGKTMDTTDSFAGAIVEFGATNDQSYTANNDLFRQTGGTFMLNKIIFSGKFQGKQDQSATVLGRDLLFTNDLSGVGPKLSIEASNGGETQFSYALDTNIQLFNALTITGDGDVAVTIGGFISDYEKQQGLTKTGSCTVVLSAENTYQGGTTIEAGVLKLSGKGSIPNSEDVEVKNGATFDVSSRDDARLNLGRGQTLLGNGTLNGDLYAETGSAVAPGPTIGPLLFNDNVVIRSGATVRIDLSSNGDTGIKCDQLRVAKSLMVNGGTLVVATDCIDKLAAGDQFHVFDANVISGRFDRINLPRLTGGLRWDSNDLMTSGTLRIEGGITAINSVMVGWSDSRR